MSLPWGKFVQQGALTALDVHLAEALGRLGGERNEQVLLAGALASRVVGLGHVCLDLEALGEGAGLPLEGAEALKPHLPDPRVWREALEASPLAGGPGEGRPLVLEGGRLYLARYYGLQERLARALLERGRGVSGKLDGKLFLEGLDRLLPPEGPGNPGGQRLAGITALLKRFAVITGGPGTGKTTVVSRILALFAEQALRHGLERPRMMVLAPTGKAAARIKEALGKAAGEMDCPGRIREILPREASTIHRALGTYPGSLTRFRHNEENPLPADLVVVDEASMVDLPLMARLVGAVRPAARLVLLGDKDQLASVEAGSILGDICSVAAGKGLSREFRKAWGEMGGEDLPGKPDSEESGIADSVVFLTRNFRFGEKSGIGRLAQAVREGDPAGALALLEDPSFPGVRREEPRRASDLYRVLGAATEEKVRLALSSRKDPARALESLGTFQVLSPHRKGREGVESLNEGIRSFLAARPRPPGRGEVYEGRPVMVLVNDYDQRLFNGDVGLFLAQGGEVRAFFPGEEGEIRDLSPARLPGHETVFAMTVHKSQGSEFDRAALVLPGKDSPLLTRELVYTAVTRARRSVILYGSPEILAAALSRRTLRFSGLGEALAKKTPSGA